MSDTMAGTLWVADALFAFANASAQAFHLHWGLGGLPYEGGSPNVGVQTNFDYNVSICMDGWGAGGLAGSSGWWCSDSVCVCAFHGIACLIQISQQQQQQL